MADKPIHVCMTAPLPPPYGGIGHWTSMIMRYVGVRKDIGMCMMNTAPYWRTVDKLAVFRVLFDRILRLPYDLVKFAFIIMHCRPDVAHITSSGRLGVVRHIGFMQLAKLRRIPSVYHIHFGRIPQIAKDNTLEWRLLAWAMRMAHTVVPIDQATEAAIAEYLPDVRIQRIPNCINPEELPPSIPNARNERVVLFLGWVIPSKGIEELIQAWTRLHPQGWRLRVIGPGDDAYQQQLMERFHPEGVEFSGEMDHESAMKAMAAADVFVLPSHTEGFPNAVLEAMTLGKAIIASAVGAVPEMLSDGCGVVIEPTDVDGLTQALSNLIENDDLRSSLAARAKDRATRNYSIDVVFQELMKVWQGAASTTKKPRS